MVLLGVAFAAVDASAQSVTLSVSPATLAEDAAATDVTVTATLSEAQTDATTVTLSLAGTARATDYTVLGSIPSITIPPNETSADATLVVSPVDDAFYEGDETVTVDGAAGSLAVTGASLTLTDTEALPTLTITASGIRSVDEGATRVLDLTALLDGTFEDDVVIRVSVHLSTTASSTDYSITPSLPAELNVEAGTQSVVREFTVMAVDDDLAERSEWLRLRAAVSYRGSTIESNNLRFVRIADDDGAVATLLAPAPYFIYAGESTTVTFGVRLSRSLGQNVSFGMTPPSAQTTWFEPSSGTITVAAGETYGSATFIVTPPGNTPFGTNGQLLVTYPQQVIGSAGHISMRVVTNRAPRIAGELRWSIGPGVLPAGSTVSFETSFDRPFELLTGTLTLTLDSGNVVAPCVLDSTIVRCEYLIRPGDYDFDGSVSVAPGGLQFTWRDERDSSITWPVPTYPSTARQLPLPRIYGGQHAIDLSVSPQTLQEGTGATSLTVRAIDATQRLRSTSLTVPFVFQDGTTSSADYVVTGQQTVTIPAGELEGSTTVTFTPVDDFVKESRVETVRVEADPSMPSIFARAAELRILDAPSIALSASPGSVSEDGGGQTVTVTAALGDATDQVRPREIPVTLTFAGSAVEGDDFSVTGETVVTIPANARSGTTTLTLTPVNDRLLEMDETIELRGSTPGLLVEGTALTLADDDMTPEVVLAVDDATVLESETGGSAVRVTATLDPSVMVSADVVVTLDLGGTATEGASGDYTASWSPSARQITIPSGSDAGLADVTLTLTPQQDTEAEGDETIVVQGTAVVQDTEMGALTVQVATVTLEDDDTQGVVIEPRALEVAEGGSASYTVVLASQPTADVVVGMTTALADTDLTVVPAALTFTVDDWDTEQTVTVSAADDADPDDDEVTLSHTASGGGYDSVAVDDVVVTVTDDDEDVTVSVAAASTTEGSDVTFTAELSRAVDFDVVLGWSTGDDGTAGARQATSGTDYTAVTSGSVTVVAGDTAATFSVSTTQDTDTEGDETFAVTVTGTALPEWVTIPTASAVGTIEDDDAATVSVAAASATEGSDVTFTVELSKTVGSDVVLGWSTDDDGTSGARQATSGTDYTAVTDGSVTVVAGATEATFSVSTTQDSDTESDETFAVTVVGSTLPPGVTVDTATAVGTIEDDDAATVSVAAASATEGSDVTFTVELSKTVGSDVVLGWSTGDDDTPGARQATSGTDYTAVTDGSVTVVAGATEATFSVSTTQDTLVEGDETFAVTVVGSTLPPGVTVETGTAVGTITEDDTPDFTLAVDPASIAEDGGTSTVTVSSGGVTFATDQTITLTLTGSATQETDYTIGSASLTLEAGGASVTTTVTAVDDSVDDDGETVVIEASLGGNLVGTSQTVTITDDDEKGLDLSPTSLNPNEGGTQTYTVVLSSEPTDTVTVTMGGTAGTDLTLDKTSLTFTTLTWGTAQTVTVTAGQDDDAVDDTATLTHTATGGDYAGETADLPVTVNDDESVGIVLTPTSLNPNEGGTPTYTVVLSSEPTTTVTVAISGTSNTDLTLDTTSLTFTTSTWGTAQTVTVTVGQDADAVDDTATLLHTASGGDYAGRTADLPVTVNDDETVGIVLMPTSLSPNEGSSPTYTVVLSSEPTATVTVAISGTSNTDLTLDTTSLTFTTSTWGTAQTVTVTVGQDADAVDDTATLTHTASGGDYAGETASLPVTLTDDESVGLVLTPASLNPNEGGTRTYTVVLSSEPTDTVTVTMGGTAGTDLTLDTTSLTFTTSTWGTAQTVTVTVGQDADAVDDTATLTHTATGGDYAGETADLPVTVNDDESVGIVLTPTSLNPNEGGTPTYTVVLSSEPTTTVTVAISGTSNTDLTLDTTSLTFTTSTWGTAQTVTVTVGQDADAVDDTATLTHTASGGDYAGETASLPVTLTDDESVGIVLTPTSLNPNEGGTRTYTVVLSSEPTDTVTVTMGGTAGTDLTLDTTSLTFTTSTWGTAQTVTVTVGQDADAVDDTATLTHTATGGDYAGETADLPVTVTDDESVGIVLTPTSLNPTEGGTPTYTVVLSSEPTATVTVTIGGTAGTDLTLDTTSLTFTTSTWGTAQTVTVTVGQDADAVDDTATLTHTASGGDYGSATASLSVTVDDDETVGLVLSKTSLMPSEGGNESYTVVLSSAPTAPVTVTIGGTSNSDLTLDKTSLTFTTSTWSTAQTVTVSAGQDADAVDDTATLTHTASGGDYGGETADLPVTVNDDESVGIVLTPTSLNPNEGGRPTYTVSLSSAPTAPVTVAISGTLNTDLTLDKTSLTFTTSTWETAQTVTVTVGQDADAVDDTATLTHTASGGDYGSATASLSVTVDDDETVGLVLSKTSLMPSEGGNESYTVVLSSEPTATVTVAISGTLNTDLTLDKTSLTFTTSTWGTAQTVTVSAGQDADAADDSATLTHTASGGDYAGETADLPVTVNDDETVGIVLTPTSLNPNEGSSPTYTVSLSSEPTAPVTVAISGTSNTDLTLDTTSLTFTTSTWETAQTVTVTVGQDADAVDDTATLTHTASGGDYAGRTADLPVTVNDDESVGIVLTPTSLNPNEGGTPTYTVVLSSEPTDTVTVAIGGTAGTDLTLDTTSLTFTTSTWETAQTVTVTVGQDADAVDDTATLTHTASGGDYAGRTADLPVTVNDDESVGIVLTPTSLNPNEGGTPTYTVVLSSAPTATVTVTIGGTAGTDLTLDTTSLTFTTSTWETAQTVTVTVGSDADAADDSVTLTHTASGGDYGSATASLSVTVDDDETVGLVLSKTSLMPSEGGNESYTVVLSSAPTATVTVTIGGTSNTDLMLDTTSLTFTTSTWSTAQTVTVSAGQDDDAVDDTATLTHTASGGDYAGETADLPVTVNDDESVGIVLTPTSLNPNEGGTPTYTVVLSSAPTATVTVTIGGTAGTDLTLDTTSLTFTTSTWETAQTVTVTVGSDADAVDDTATLTHTATGGDYAGETADLPVTVNDDESVGIVLTPTSLSPNEGGTPTYTVVLSSEPTATVTVTIGGTAGTDLTLDKTSLTFTTLTWGTAQTVTVTVGSDADAADDTATLTHTASGGDYAGAAADVLVTVSDDESVGLVLSKTSLNPGEGGNESYTVALSSQPTASVTVTIGGTSRTDLTLSTMSLTFSTSTWGTARTVTVSAGQDADATDDTATLTHTATGGDYAGATADVLVTVSDDESVGLVLSKSSLTPGEGSSASYTVKLSSQPSASVTVTITGTSGTDLTLNTSSLTFSTSTWGTVQTVTVSAGEDADAADDEATLTHTASGGDYEGKTAELSVTVDDDELVGVELSASSLTPSEGGSASYTVKLSTQPSASVTVTITGTTGTDLSLDTTSLTFTTSDWGTAQTVTVSAGEDADATDDEATLTHTASGGDYAGATAELSVTVDDDESVGVELSASSLTPSEGGSASYTVKLSTQPSASVTVTITGTTGTDLSLDTTSLTFTTSDWGTAQTVTVSAGEDADATDDEATLTHTASGGDYAGATAELSVTVADDESVGLVLSESSLNPTEGGDASYTVTLSTAPTATVTVAVTGHSGTDLSLSTSSLTFTTSDWGTAQTVTVSAGQDDDATDDEATLTHTASGADYGGETAELSVTVADDESAATELTLTVAPTSVSENGGGTEVTVTGSLDGAPRAAETVVTVSVAGDTADADDFVAVPPFELTIAANATEGTATFMLTPVDDELGEGAETVTVTGTTTAPDLTVVPAALTITDDDEATSGIALSVEPARVDEGAGATEVTVTATLDGAGLQSATVVQVTVAEKAHEYAVSPAAFEVEIPEGATSGSGRFELTPVEDGDDEPDERVVVSGETSPMPVQPVTLLITDNDESNTAPTFGQDRYTFDLPENRSGREEPVELGTVGAHDPDGDDLRYALATGDRDRFTVSREVGTVSYIGEGEDFETGPSEFPLEVTTQDGEQQARAQVLVRVVDAPESPEAENDRAETPEDTPTVIDVLTNDSDPDGDKLRVASVSAPAHGTATVVSGGVRYEPDLNWYGEDRFGYKVADPGGLTSRATVRVTVTPVNDPPEAVDDEAETLEDVPAVVDVLANDTDVDGDPLEVVSVGPAGHGTTAVVSGGVRYASALNWYGTDRFSYTIADPEGLTATATVTMTVLPVNDPPEAVGVISDQAVEEGGLPVTVDVLPYFTDVDGDVLTYTAVSSDEMAVTVSVSGSTLTLSPVVAGRATVTVTAADVEGLTAVQRFGVAVGDRLVRGVLVDTLAGFGRGHLSSVRMTVGRLLESGGGGMTRLMVAGQHLSPDAWRQMGAGGLPQSHELLFRAATLQQRRSATDLVGTSADPRLRGPGSAGMPGGGFGVGGREQLLQGTDVLLSFGGGDDEAPAAEGVGVGRWRVWGQGDRQSFRGAPAETTAYEGDLLSGYVGLDVRLRERLLAGVAVGRSGGGGDWQVGPSSGELATELTVLHPYVRWGDQERAVWAVAGIGRGTAENVRALTGRRGASPLHLALGLLEGRQRVAATGAGLEVHLRGEASWARLRTGAGEETVDGLEARVRRVRSGVEVTLPWQVRGGMTLAPFGAVSTRHDGGDGQTGVGLEVAGGVRLNTGRVRVEAQGRMLALHTATEYEERGVSVTATVGSGLYEPGLTASLRPRWGAPGYGAESLWQDHLHSYAEGTGRDDVGVDGRVGYGLRLPGERLLTPFGGYGRTRGAERMQVGANLGLEGLFNGDLASPVQVEFMGERYARPGGADHRVSLYGIVNFGARPRRPCNPAVAPCTDTGADAARAAPPEPGRSAAAGI